MEEKIPDGYYIPAHKSLQEEIDRCRKLLIQELTGREEGYTDGKHLIVGRRPLNCLEHIR